MRRTPWPAATFAVLLAAASPGSPAATQLPARDVVLRGIDAIGGEAAVRQLTGLSWDFYGVTFGIGQSETPASPPRASVAIGRLVTDWQGSRRFVRQEIRGPGGASTEQRGVFTPAAGVSGPPSQQAPMSFTALAGAQRGIRTAPHRLLLAALDPSATLRAVPPRVFRGMTHDGVWYGGADTATLFFDRLTGLLTVYEVTTDDPILGNRISQTWLTRWQGVSGVLYPRQFDTFVNGQLQGHSIISNVAEIQPADSMFPLPDSVTARPPQAAAPAPLVVRLEELGPGLWRAEGGTHHSLVVEQPTMLVLIEAPQSTQRVRAVLDTLRSRFPTKRVGLAVMTHHHWDHAGGIREVIAEGIPIATHEVNAAFVRQVAAARRTVAPDLQATRRRVPVVRSFRDSMVVGSGETALVLYHQPTSHVQGMLTAWVPAAGLLFTSDVAAGPEPTRLGSAEMLELARARGLNPRRYAGGHGSVVNWMVLERSAGGAR
jgi:glyoxylase-like metal-dependent hydrolase (beta-lactamase superfamily II)